MTESGAGRLGARRALPLGIEIEADLSAPLTPGEREELRTLLGAHGLILFRNQALSHPAQIDILSAIGPVLQAADGVGYISTDETKGGLGSYELAYHSDLAFTPHPFQAISLHAVDVVDDATSTRFCSSVAAYGALPPALRARIEGLALVSAMPVNNSTDQVGQPIAPGMPSFARPAVIAHPATGAPILYVSQQQAVRFEGLEPAESTALIRELLAHLMAPGNVYEHRWRKGDFVIWDNLALQHARGDLTGRGPRTLQRVVVAEKSFYELCPQFDPDNPGYKRWLNAASQADAQAPVS